MLHPHFTFTLWKTYTQALHRERFVFLAWLRVARGSVGGVGVSSSPVDFRLFALHFLVLFIGLVVGASEEAL